MLELGNAAFIAQTATEATESLICPNDHFYIVSTSTPPSHNSEMLILPFVCPILHPTPPTHQMHIVKIGFSHRLTVQEPGDAGCWCTATAKQTLQDKVTALCCVIGRGCPDCNLRAFERRGKGRGGEGVI